MKYTPKKVFILEEGKYKEITYAELQNREAEREEYRSKRFLPLYGMLMEVTKEDYRSYYKDERRQRYIEERARKFGLFSYDALTTEEFNGEDILVDLKNNPEETIERHMMIEMILDLFQKLKEDERELLRALYFEGMSEREYASMLGVYPNAVHKRKLRILEKLRKMIGM